MEVSTRIIVIAKVSLAWSFTHPSSILSFLSDWLGMKLVALRDYNEGCITRLCSREQDLRARTEARLSSRRVACSILSQSLSMVSDPV